MILQQDSTYGVLPNAKIAMAAALSIVLGLITWVALNAARSLAGSTVAAAG